MSLYRKKPVVIEAVQFTADNRAEVMAWCGATKDAMTVHKGIAGFCIPTLEDGDDEGQHIALVDDWIIRGVKGEFYPCKPDIFEQSYEIVALAPIPPTQGDCGHTFDGEPIRPCPICSAPSPNAQSELVHSDHPLRHWDRTCPGCLQERITELEQRNRELEETLRSLNLYSNIHPKDSP